MSSSDLIEIKPNETLQAALATLEKTATNPSSSPMFAASSPNYYAPDSPLPDYCGYSPTSPQPFYNDTEPRMFSPIQEPHDDEFFLDRAAPTMPMPIIYGSKKYEPTPAEKAFLDGTTKFFELHAAKGMEFDPVANAIFWAFVNTDVTFNGTKFGSSFRTMGGYLIQADPEYDEEYKANPMAYMTHYSQCTAEIDRELTNEARLFFSKQGFSFAKHPLAPAEEEKKRGRGRPRLGTGKSLPITKFTRSMKHCRRSIRCMNKKKD